MKTTTKLALANVIAALAALASAVAEEMGGSASPESIAAPAATPTGEPEKPKRGRPAAEKKEESEQPKVEKPAGKTLDELKAACDSLVKGGEVAKVKDIIAKHGGTKLSDLPAENHAAFIAEIEALSI
jgi:hypothetical protein